MSARYLGAEHPFGSLLPLVEERDYLRPCCGRGSGRICRCLTRSGRSCELTVLGDAPVLRKPSPPGCSVGSRRAID